MRNTDRARLSALTVLAAVAGSASAGLAVIVREGVCLHRMAAEGAGPAAMLGMPGMPAGSMTAAGAMTAPCPVLLGAAIVAAVVCAFAVLAVALARPSASELACSLLGPARAVLAFARRLAGVLAAAFELLARASGAVWAPARAGVRVPAGVRLARRRPSRAPPLRF